MSERLRSSNYYPDNPSRPGRLLARAHLVILVAVVVAMTIGCSGKKSSGNGATKGGPGETVSAGSSSLRVPDGTPIILISVDTLRSDRLPAYGYDGVETPAIDKLRQDSVLFERAYAHVPLTLPSHTSLLTGLLPSVHGVRDNLGYSVDPEMAPLLQQTLKAAGYATGAGVSAFALRRSTGIANGFDTYLDEIDPEMGSGIQDIQAVQRSGAETLNAVRPWLRSVSDRPFFLFFHIFEPHTPYEPPAKYAALYPSPYDGEVAAADDIVGDFLEELRGLGVYEKALIIFLSDHGEGLGDHGEEEHGLFLYRSTLQVPLMLKLPQSERGGETATYPVQLIDVYPTLTSALDLPYGEDLQGTPLLAASRPELWDNPIYAETYFPRLHFGWSDIAALFVGQHHYIDAPQSELFNVVVDPDELDDLIGSDPELEAEFHKAMGAYDRRLEEPSAADAETRRRLEALGYVGAASTTEEDVLPDPKTRVGAMADIQKAYRLYHAGDLEAAVPALQKILKENPKIEDAWGYLTLAQLELGRPQEAASTFRAALAELPNSRRLSLRAAQLLEHMGRLDEATEYAKKAISYDPPAAHLLLAQIAFKRGNLDVAEAEAREALANGDRRPAPRLILADVYIAQGNPYQAIDLLTRAMEEGVVTDAIRAKLAITYVWIGRFDEAEKVLTGFETTNDLSLLMTFGRLAAARERWDDARIWFERALLVDPNNVKAKLDLGLIAMTQGRLPDAQKYLEEAVAGNPRSMEGWSVLGMVYARQGNAQRAIVAWERAREINPDIIDVLFNLGVAYAQLGRLPQAIQCLEDFAARAPEGQQKEQALTMVQQLRLRAPQTR